MVLLGIHVADYGVEFLYEKCTKSGINRRSTILQEKDQTKLVTSTMALSEANKREIMHTDFLKFISSSV